MKIKILLIASILQVGFLQVASSAIRCECGTHATAITSYLVTGDDCCLSVPYALADEYTYTLQPNGVWQHTGTTVITGSSAQSTCCPNP